MRENNRVTVKNVVTKENLIRIFKKVGVGPNMIIEVHSSLSAFGYVVGGARTVVDALMETVGESGTILMPAQSSDNTDPSGWVNPPLSPELWKVTRDAIPPYDPEYSDITNMGDVVENFRHRPGVVCSNHPNVSYVAWGRYAKLLCNRQSIHFPLSEESPTARLYELRGYVLLLGTDFTTCTAMHLAEYRTECRPIIINNACTVINGVRTWKKYLDLDIDSGVFERVKESLVNKNMINETMLNNAKIQLFPAYIAVDEAVRFLEKNSVYDLYR